MFWSFSSFVSLSLRNFSKQVKFISFSRFKFLVETNSILFLFHLLVFISFLLLCMHLYSYNEYIKRSSRMNSIGFVIYDCALNMKCKRFTQIPHFCNKMSAFLMDAVQIFCRFGKPIFISFAFGMATNWPLQMKWKINWTFLLVCRQAGGEVQKTVQS